MMDSITAVTVSSTYHIVIPKTICDALSIRPGQKMQVIQYQNRIELIPIRPIKATRGFLKGINTIIQREKS